MSIIHPCALYPSIACVLTPVWAPAVSSRAEIVGLSRHHEITNVERSAGFARERSQKSIVGRCGCVHRRGLAYRKPLFSRARAAWFVFLQAGAHFLLSIQDGNENGND